MKTEKELIKEANDIIRSFNSVIERSGAETNWEALNKQVKRILKEQHEYMFAEPHEVSLVRCDFCSKQWTAVRPEGLTKIECPACGNMVPFENISST